MASFDEVLKDCTKLGTKIPTNEYLKNGKYPVIDQGQSDIAGYHDSDSGLFENVPAIVFGDHTRAVKYVDKPCFLGADGVKLLCPLDKDINCKYLFYQLSCADIPNTGYNRHFKWVKALDFKIPSSDEQNHVVEVLDKVTELISFRKQQLAKLDELVKARFVEMFGKASLLAQNQAKRLEECCISISGGNTPSMQHPEYYGGNIPFVKSGDVKGDYIVESTLTLTKTALTETTAKILPKSTLIVVIRSAALLKEFRIGMLMVDAVINQDLKALQVSEDFLPVYLMWAIKMQHQVLLNKVQTMLTSHIRMEDLLNLKIGTPPLSLQNQFAAFVERVDQQKQTVQQSLEKLELMKKALMQEYFR